jgi:hypothetical protein
MSAFACVVSTKPKSFVSDAVDAILPLQFEDAHFGVLYFILSVKRLGFPLAFCEVFAPAPPTAPPLPYIFRGRALDGSWQPPKIEKRV